MPLEMEAPVFLKQQVAAIAAVLTLTTTDVTVQARIAFITPQSSLLQQN